MVGNPVKFAYIATGGSLPETYPDADTIYFLEEDKEIRVGNETLGNVDDLAIHPEELMETLAAWTVKSVEFIGSGNNVSDITFDDSTGRLTITRSDVTIPPIEIGVPVIPEEPTQLDPEGTFNVVTGTTVGGAGSHTITNVITKFKLPDSKVYEAGNGIVIDGDTISLPQVFYDYLVEKTFAVPTIASFAVTGLGSSAEIGTSVTVSAFTHAETNISNIEGNLTFKHGSTVISNTVAPSSSSRSVSFSEITVTRTTPGNDTFTLSGVDKLGQTLSKSVSKSFYIPKFLGADVDPTVTDAEVLNMSRGSSIPTTITFNTMSYVYFITDGTINSIKDADTGFGVAYENLDSMSIAINSVPVTYHVYRTSSRINPGTYKFVIA